MRLRLRVTPKSRADEVGEFREDGVLVVRVKAPAQEGKANDAVIRVLGRALALPRGAIRIVAGASSRDKWVELDGIDAASLERRLRTDRT